MGSVFMAAVAERERRRADEIKHRLARLARNPMRRRCPAAFAALAVVGVHAAGRAICAAVRP